MGRAQRLPRLSNFPRTRAREVACPPTTTNGLHKPARAPEGQALGQPRRARPPVQRSSPAALAGACPPTSSIGPHKPARAPEGQALGQARHARPPAHRSSTVALAQPARSPAQGGAACPRAAAAVAEFVALLDHGGGARATGSELFRAYATRRATYGLPELRPNIFGMHLKACVEAVGGRKFKSCGQVYEGVCIPASWREPLVQSA